MNAFIVTKTEKSLVWPSIPEEVRSMGNLLIGCTDENGLCVGASVFRIDGDRSQLIYIFVAEAYRRRGAGSAMIDLMIRFARKKNISGIEADFFLENDTNDIYKLLLSLSFTEDDAGRIPELVTNLKILSQNVPKAKCPKDVQLVPLSMISNARYTEAREAMIQSVDKDSLVKIFPKDCYSQEYSFLAYLENKPIGGILIRKLAEKEMQVSYLWMNKSISSVLVSLLNACVETAMTKLPLNTAVRA